MRNLKSWPPGISGNLKGRPKGSRNVKTVIREMLDNQDTWKIISGRLVENSGTPLEAVIAILIERSLDGDIRAADILFKYAVDREDLASNELNGFFNANEIVIKIVDSKGSVINQRSASKINENGQLEGFEDKA